MKIRQVKRMGSYGLSLGAAIFMNFSAMASFCPSPTSASVTVTNITCAGSGAITINTVIDGGSAINLPDCRFILYDATNTNIVKPEQTNPIIGGLNAGTYVLHIHQVCQPSGISADYTQTVTLTGIYESPVMNVDFSSSSCNNGTISISASKGYGTYSYCLVNSLNDPATPSSYVRAPQSSSTFTGLAPGIYYVRVYDQCTGFVTTQVDIPSIPNANPFGSNDISLAGPNGCDGYSALLYMKWPIPVDTSNTLTVTYPDGSTASLSGNGDRFTFPISNAQLGNTFPATITVTYHNACGGIYTYPVVINQPDYVTYGGTQALSYTCGMGEYPINNTYAIDRNNNVKNDFFIWNQYSLDSGKTWITYNQSANDTLFISAGNSQMIVYQRCGMNDTVVISMPAQRNLDVHPSEIGSASCNGNSGISFYPWSLNGTIDKVLVHVVSVPPGQAAIPDFYLPPIYAAIQTQNLVPGTYVFDFTDQCGVQQNNVSFTISASIQQMSVTPVVACGANLVGLDMYYKNDKDGDMILHYSIMNSAGDYVAGTPYSSYIGTAKNGIDIIYNNLPPDVYTVHMWKSEYGTTYSDSTICMQTFTVSALLPTALALNNSVFALCTNDPSTGTVIAVPQGGTPPYIFTLYKGSIAAGNEVGASQSSPIFNNLNVNATYWIVATDQCGKGTSYSHILGNVQPVLGTSSPLVPCPGEAITLWVNNNPALSYQWTHNGINIPGSTDTSYSIPSMTMADSGAYQVNISANSCLLLSVVTNLNPNKCGGAIPLAIDMVSFSGKLNAQDNAVLNWKIAHTEPGAKFEVLYSTDGNKFASAGIVYEDGTATTFNFIHQNYTVTQKTFYKLLMTEKDGKQRYSTTLVLQPDKNALINTALAAAPIPFSNSLNISYTSATDIGATLSLTDVQGRVLKMQSVNVVSGANSFTMTGLETLANGIYLLSIQDNNRNVKETIKIQK